MKKLLILALILAFTAMTASAQVPAKPMTIYGGVGMSLPTSPDEFKDFWSMGFHGLGAVGFNAAPKLQLLGKIEYHNFAFDWGDIPGDGGAISFLMIGGDVKLNLGVPLAPTKPFILGGVGMATASIDLPGAASETGTQVAQSGNV